MATVFINEFHYDNSGPDSNEFIEIAGPAGTDLTGWSIVFYNGNENVLATYNTINLSGTISDQSNGFGTVAVDFNSIQNGSPDGIALVDNNSNVVQFLSYEGSFTPVNGPAVRMTSTDIGVSQSNSTPLDSSLQLQGTGSEDSDFSWVAVDGSNTKGNINASQTFSVVNNDTTAPELNDTNPLTPADDATNTLIDANLTIKFNESVQKGTGNIVIKKSSDNSVVETFDVATSTAVTVSGDTVTINPTANLEVSTGFYVEIDAGAIQDTAGNNFAGISGSDTWNFTTGTEDSITPIYEIQGAGHTSPFVTVDFANLPADTFTISGSEVTTTGIVTAVDSNGFYLQDPTGDGNDATSDAIFVFTSSTPTVTVGDEVEVTGTVAEFFPGTTSTRNLPTTQISSPTVTVNSSGNALPTATIIGAGGRTIPTENIDDDAFGSFEPDTDGIDFFESLEGMRVTAKDAVAVAPTNRFGEIFTVVDNGAGATGISDRGTLNISPDDFNPEKVQIDEDSGVFNFDFPNVDVGAKLGDVTGVVGYSFGNFEIYPTEDFTGNIVESTIEAETTTIEGSADKLTVASYNLLNLDPNDTDGDTDVANGRFDAIAVQIVNNLKAPDIIGLQEIQDNSGSNNDGTFSANDTLQLLVDAIAAAGGPRYSFVDNFFIGDDTNGGQPVGNIRTAFLYNPDRVSLDPTSVKSIQDSDQQTNSDNPFFDARLPIVATFTFNGQEVTVVNNHFSSKGGSSPILGVEQPFEARQEEKEVNGSLDERQAQAQAVKDYVDGILAADADANVVVLGDLNEFEFVSPVTNLAQNLTNLTETVPEDERYSFIFQGNSQSLDHILVSGNLADNAEFDIVHVNSEFAETSERASDHDPLVASLSIPTENMDKINLSQLGTFTSDNGAEIVAHDPTTQRLFVTTGNTVEIIDISDPANPTKVSDIAVTSIDGVTYGGANSVAVKNGIVAIAIEAENSQENGIVAFYDVDGVLQNTVTVGALPDMLTFTPDGTKVIVANEGEPNDEYTVDPEGSISIIDISGGIGSATVMTAGFAGFNDRKQELINKGVRIFGPNATVAQDLEPEFIAVSPDGSTAVVTLQENNAIAVVNIENGTVEDVLPLGVKDHSKGQPTLTQYEFSNLPVLGTTATVNPNDATQTTPGQDILLGGLSGLYYEGLTEDGNLKFVTVPDRGPNGDPTDVDNDGGNERPFALPDYQARVVKFELNETTGAIENLSEVLLTREDGVTPITGRPNIPGIDEEPVDLFGNLLDYDPFGADLEGIVVDGDGNYWMVDEYRPAIYNFDSTGKLINRFVPQGTGALAGQPADTFGTETLPAEYSNRRRNRGFEAVSLDAENGILYAFIQTPLANPDRDASDNSDIIRILGINTATGEAVAEYVYLLEDPAVRDGGRVDKIGDAVYVGDGKFKVIERDSAVGENAKKFIFEIDLKGATNLLADGAPSLIDGKTLEQHTADELEAQGISLVNKTKVLNLPSIGYQAGDKPEGLAYLPGGRLAVLNDNDFGLLDNDIPIDGTVPVNPNPTPVVLGIIEFDEGNQLDASNRDGGINIQNHPVFGLYQPDSIASFEVDGKTYYITANEGDARDYDGFSEEVRVNDLTLDPTVFPDAATLQQDENLGRLRTTNASGDTDGDGDFDKIFSYGGRSFSIWDEVGNLVFDSSDEIAKITASLVPQLFNADDGDLGEFDQRSDDKGAEPEAVTVGKINGKPYGFIGLERTGGVLVYDLSNPTTPEFIQYITTEGDIGPEGLKFIAAEDSPNGEPMLAVANEESNTTTLYGIEVPNYKLQILHASDLEGGVDAIDSAANFAAIVDKFEDEVDNTIILSAGDNYIPGPFFGAAGDGSLRTPLQEFYQEFFNEAGLTNVREGVGRVDISIMNAIGFDASAVGNHEFDAGTNAFGDIIGTDIRGTTLGDVRWLGAQFPYLSANLDFSGDSNLSGLFTDDILTNTAFQSLPSDLTAAAAAPKIAPATIIEEGGDRIGVVGATTQLVETISSTGGVDVIDPESNDMTALAAILQPTINDLIAQGINKVVVVSHLQQIALEKELAGLLSGVDVIIAGGSDTLQADSTDRLRDGDTAAEDYPFTTTNADGDPTVIVSTNGEYSYVGRLVVEFDTQGRVIVDSIDENVSGAYATDDQGVTDVYGADIANAFAEGSKGEQVQDLTEAVENVVTENDGIIFGKTDVFLEGRRSEVRTQETNFGNLTADANLAAAKKADESVVISIKNGGGIRSEIGSIDGTTGELGTTLANPEAGKEAGEISQLDLENSLRFNNGLTLLTVTAQELLDIIEHGVSASGDGATPGQFPQVSGLKFSFDDDLPAGDRVQSLAVVDENGNILDVVAENGEIAGDASRTFRIVTLGFLADGGDGFPFPQTDRVDLEAEGVRTGLATAADDGTEQDALAEYLVENFAGIPFNTEDVSEEFDTRIQNLDFREDTVLDLPSGLIQTQTLADGSTVEAIDLTGFDAQPTVSVNYTITREAAFDNEVYFYAVDDINGSVNGVNVGDANYVEEALKQLVSPKFSTTDGNTENGTAQLNAGSIVVPVIIADGTFAEALSGAAEIYFPYLGANSDGQDHIRFNETTNTFEFEDLPGLGDQDFNDITIKINGIA